MDHCPIWKASQGPIPRIFPFTVSDSPKASTINPTK
ncbi:hypothetical protein CGLO_08271 [Colletotrichum gloeosporioides Cg-14]|uniref:Uncharacterized protein n=1 Tax=Colletotrichum gloeosporioides (strain Cg-14) TaxID=1237896 RepID=T0LKE9_COLGC|nr:hypothetical protein CGLO_08271 [Colletotrichum gloeosporioides Cg-14]